MDGLTKDDPCGWVGLLNAGHPLDALRTKRFLDQTPVLHDLYFLQVGLKLTFCGFHGETSVLSECGRLATIFALCHRKVLPYRNEISVLNSR